MTAKRVSPESLRSMLTDGGEIALLDVRDQGPCGRGHPLLATNVPVSGIELTIRRFVPRLSTRIVLCDDDDGLADQAADVLAKAGYGDLAVLDGGIRKWAAAEFELFIGSYTVTNCFGLHVDLCYGTPHISAAQLKTKIDAGEELVVLDSRPDYEFTAGSIPGAIDVPGGELVYRIRDVAPRVHNPDHRQLRGQGALDRGQPVADQRRGRESRDGADPRHHGLVPRR